MSPAAGGGPGPSRKCNQTITLTKHTCTYTQVALKDMNLEWKPHSHWLIPRPSEEEKSGMGMRVW